MKSSSSLNVAVIGCAHGELDQIYASVATAAASIDLVLVCGDFQAVRNRNDLLTMAVPPKYRQLGTFYKYYSGEKRAPILTIFIGGNHEASSVSMELFPGGWAAPNIYFMGAAGVIRFAGLRIAALGGIYKAYDYRAGYFESFPLSHDHQRSIYHVRQFDVQRLSKLSGPIDIFMSHDWPVGITDFGNVQKLVRQKPFFRQDIEQGRLGNPETMPLLKKLQPAYWFAAHLHCKFAAVVNHGSVQTKFLALDKCLRRRPFLQVLSFPATEPKVLSHDPEWLAIVKAASPYLSLERRAPLIPDYEVSPDDIEQFSKQDLTIREELFSMTVPVYDENDKNDDSVVCKPVLPENSQVAGFYTRLGIPDPMASKRPPPPPQTSLGDPNEINIDL